MGKDFIPPHFLEPHYSTKSWRGYYFYLKRFYSEDIFQDICKSLGMPLGHVLGDDNWVSNSFLSAFLDELSKRVGDPEVALKAGRFSLRQEAINPFEYTLLKNMGPFLFFQALPHQFSKMSMINQCSIRKFGPGNFSLEVRPKGAQRSHPDACQNTIGAFLGAQDIYDLEDMRVTHAECIHKGSNSCVFEISYKATKYWRTRAIGLGVSIVLLTALTSFAPTMISQISISAVLSFCSLLFGLFYFWRYRGLIKYNRRYYEESQKKNLEIYQSRLKLDRRYQESNLLRDLSLRLVRLNSSKEVIKSCLDDLSKRFGYSRTLIMLASGEEQHLYVEDLRGFSHESDTLFSLKVKYPADSQNPHFFANILANGNSTFIKEIDVFKQSLKPKNRELIELLGVNSLIVAPIQDSEKKYGLLIVGSIRSDKQLMDEDRHLLDNVSRMLSLFFQNARNYEKEKTLRNLFQKYVPPVVIESVNLLESDRQGYLTPKNNAVTSMFVDLRDFTSSSESMTPEKVIDMLNIYAGYVTAIIASEGGIVDNLIGDGIVAFFPADFEKRTDHARKSIIATVKILANLENLHRNFKERGYPLLGIGIGIHSGNATVGNVGSDLKLNYTAIGDTINTASRLQDLCKDFRRSTPSAEKGLAVISEEVVKRACLDIPLKDAGLLEVRGRKQSVRAFILDNETAKNLVENLEGMKTITRSDLLLKFGIESSNRSAEGVSRKDKKAS
jgi:class 3 adenylate cyclase